MFIPHKRQKLLWKTYQLYNFTSFFLCYRKVSHFSLLYFSKKQRIFFYSWIFNALFFHGNMKTFLLLVILKFLFVSLIILKVEKFFIFFFLCCERKKKFSGIFSAVLAKRNRERNVYFNSFFSDYFIYFTLFLIKFLNELFVSWAENMRNEFIKVSVRKIAVLIYEFGAVS